MIWMKQLIDFYKRKGAKTTYAGQDQYLVWRLGQNAQCQPKQAELIPIPMWTLVMIPKNVYEKIKACFLSFENVLDISLLKYHIVKL